MTNSAITDSEAISFTGRMLGALFYFSPDSSNLSALLESLQQPEWMGEWPCGLAEQVKPAALLMIEGLQSAGDETLQQAHQRLFIGPNSLPAPPWGSVYLDRESVIFGDSTLALRAWQRSLGIETQQEYVEPEDHVGLLLMLAAWLAESQPEQVNVLLADHLLPWSGRFLALMKEGAQHPFYLGLALLTEATLADWQKRLGVSITAKRLFR